MKGLTAGIAEGSHALVWVTGADAVSFLDGQISQDVAAMASGEVRRAFLLEPRGKLRAMLWVLRGEERTGLVVQSDGAAAVVSNLEQFRFRVKAELTIDPRPGHSVWGGAAAAAGWAEGTEGLTVTTPARWSVVFAPSPPEGTVLTADQFAAHRIAAAEPWFGSDVDEGTIPQETGLVPESVSFTKGCYLGQELVARIDSRGHVNRLLRRLDGTGSVPPFGAEVLHGGTAVGTTGTTAPLGEDWAGLAVLRREAAPGDAVVVRWKGGESAAVVAETSHSPNAATR
ncbi:MAG TPA: hypothetical protein VFY15_05125 [Acidimicrobiia bacterium]|nr:hypothetical protein [Acidimicrobiia bacterium]